MDANNRSSFTQVLFNIGRRRPSAWALVLGSDQYPSVEGTVSFYDISDISGGMMVVADFRGLPHDDTPCGGRVFGFHIHEGSSCAGSAGDPFSAAGGHYNPNNCPHPHHAGDLPPLFESNGLAWMAFWDDRITAAEIIGRTVIVHAQPDDFITQPSGNSGAKMACGVIEKVSGENSSRAR